MGIKKLFHELLYGCSAPDFSDECIKEESSGHQIQNLLLRCGEREIVGEEYNTLASYNHRMRATEFGTILHYRIMLKYGTCQHVYGRDDGIIYAYNFGTEENLKGFIKECRRYLGLD